MKKGQMKGFVAGMLAAALVLGLVGTAAATIGKRTVEVDYTDIKIELNGEKVTPVDANGNAVEPFAINGTTYLPVRAVSNALGLDVGWDGTTSTVKLAGKLSGGIDEYVAQDWFQVMDAYHSLGVVADDCYVLGGFVMTQVENEVKSGTGDLSSVQKNGELISSCKQEVERIGDWADLLLRSADAGVRADASVIKGYVVKMDKAVDDMVKACANAEDLITYGMTNQAAFYGFTDYYESGVMVLNDIKYECRDGYDLAYGGMYDALYGAE